MRRARTRGRRRLGAALLSLVLAALIPLEAAHCMWMSAPVETLDGDRARTLGDAALGQRVPPSANALTSRED